MLKEVDDAYRETCRILFGMETGSLKEIEEWMKTGVPLPSPVKSAITGKEVWITPPPILMNQGFDKSRIVSFDESDKITTPFNSNELNDIELKKMKKILKPVAYYIGNFRYGNYRNVENSSGGGAGQNIYYCDDAFHGIKNVAYCSSVIQCQYTFGSFHSPYSSFCIHIYHSAKLTRCFEMDGCTDCMDSMFCHNSEGLRDCLFCFNAKNLQYAVGNVVVGKAEYERIKKILVEYIVNELKEKKKLGIGIYNLKKVR